MHSYTASILHIMARYWLNSSDGTITLFSTVFCCEITFIHISYTFQCKITYLCIYVGNDTHGSDLQLSLFYSYLQTFRPCWKVWKPTPAAPVASTTQISLPLTTSLAPMKTLLLPLLMPLWAILFLLQPEAIYSRQNLHYIDTRPTFNSVHCEFMNQVIG